MLAFCFCKADSARKVAAGDHSKCRKKRSVFLVSIIFRIRIHVAGECAVFYTDSITYYYAHAQTVSTRALPRGGGGEWPGNEASVICTWFSFS